MTTLAQALAAQTLEFPSWEEMSDIEQLHCTWWDAYKDAYGFRPRGQDVGHWTAEDFEQELNLLGKEIARVEQARREDEVRAIVKFEDRVTNLLHTGTNRDQVIAWLMDAEGANGDFEYFCYTQGLPYGYFRANS